MSRLRSLPALAILFASCSFGSSDWYLVESPNFQLYAQRNVEDARAQILWLEQLRTLLQLDGNFIRDLNVRAPSRLRLVLFASQVEYADFRLNATADAYYVGQSGRHLIVMASSNHRESAIAAHEYLHAAFHDLGLKLPSWLSEGLAELFSSAQLRGTQWEFGGVLDSRLDTLHHRSLLPLSVLFSINSASALRQSRDGDAIFYAESWALTHLLCMSAEYEPHFGDFVRSLNSGSDASRALSVIYGKSTEVVQSDLAAWIRGARFTPITLPATPGVSPPIRVTALSAFQANSLLAEVLLMQGQLDRAQAAYENLAREAPRDPDVSAALGTIALAKKNRIAAMQYWKTALDEGVTDPDLCFRYAVLADEANLDRSEIRGALSRAIALKPDFDDARFHLALLENNGGNFEDALLQLQSIHNVPDARAFHYWTAMAYALEELGRREEASSAAKKALSLATDEAERAQAKRLAYDAETDFAVQFVRNPDGTEHLVTTRVPHGRTDWNPFVQPGDHVIKADGQLLAVQCSEGRLTGFTVSTEHGSLSLVVPDPQRVLMRNSPQEFTCGPQKPQSVHIEYAANQKSQSTEGLLRGMEFR